MAKMGGRKIFQNNELVVRTVCRLFPVSMTPSIMQRKSWAFPHGEFTCRLLHIL